MWTALFNIAMLIGIFVLACAVLYLLLIPFYGGFRQRKMWLVWGGAVVAILVMAAAFPRLFPGCYFTAGFRMHVACSAHE
ncbi:MAG TPA: hypothetical protein VHL34_03995 [Rhizomicrobium sp.]|jgi:hypothetical protein|nr:hypothetical protein [Rhizomicrobium sp.]